MADAMVEKGFHKAGYEYIIIDDCWLDHKRSPEGKLQPDPKRFPNGIKALADYVHSKGLKFGIYEDYGNFTCGGYPGILGHLEIDAKTFAEWEVDYIKVDGCYADVEDMNQGYPLFGTYKVLELIVVSLVLDRMCGRLQTTIISYILLI